MYFRALAADYDGTLACHGAVEPATIHALLRLRDAGRKLVLVTGREMADLRHVMPDLTLFDRIVAENGGVLFDPPTGREKLLGPRPPVELVRGLMARGVEPISVGRTIVATWQPHEAAVLASIAELGLDWQIVFNKGAVMVLPSGVTKATGLSAALHDLGLSAANVVGVGDAENDHSFLAACGCSAAVANALPSVRKSCDLQMKKDHGAGVAELVEAMLNEDAAILPSERRGICFGVDTNGGRAILTPQESLLILGGSGSGKSRFATMLIERMMERKFSICVLDPESEYGNFEAAVAIGDHKQAGSVAEAMRLLSRGLNVVFGTLAINLDARRQLFARLVPQILALHASQGRPHWIVVDEAHHYLSRSSAETGVALAQQGPGMVLATITPDWLPRQTVSAVDHVLAFGGTALELLTQCSTVPLQVRSEFTRRSPDQALLWSRRSPEEVRLLHIQTPTKVHERHRGKYALGDVGEARSFYFAWSGDGADHRAHNLAEFILESRAIPAEVWTRHLRAGDFAAWFLHVIRDEELARRSREIARDEQLAAEQSRDLIENLIRDRYTIPIEGPRWMPDGDTDRNVRSPSLHHPNSG